MAEIKFKKPKKPNIRIRQESDDEDDDHKNEEDESFSSAIEEAKELRKIRRRPNGVNLEDLAAASVQPKESKDKSDPLKLKTGGFVDAKTLKRQLSAAEDIEQIGTSFASETNRCDVDMPMLNYIEEELSKRKGQASAQDELEDKPKNAEDALYALPEHIQTQASRKKNEDMISNTMLSGIPEVDLGIEVKIRNIEATEDAKQRLMNEKRQKRDIVSRFVPTNVAVNFVQHNRYNIEENRPQAKKVPFTPKSAPVRVGDAEKQPEVTNAEETQKKKRHVEKATDDFHFEKFRKNIRRF